MKKRAPKIKLPKRDPPMPDEKRIQLIGEILIEALSLYINLHCAERMTSRQAAMIGFAAALRSLLEADQESGEKRNKRKQSDE